MKRQNHAELLADTLRHSQENLRPLFESALQHAPALLDIISRAHSYCRRYLAS